MNKNLKKGLYLGGTTLAIGAIATSITLPIILQNNSFDFDYNPDDVLITGGVDDITGGDLETEVEDSGYEDTRIASSVEYQASFFLYQFEQEASLVLQEAHFQMDITNLMLDIQVEMEGRNDEEVIDDLKDDLLEIQEKLVLVQNTIKGEGDQVDYDHYRFSTDYPQVLQLEDSIRESQEKVFDDYKANFIQGYPTSADGNSAWPGERSSKYNGAETDEEAIDYLVSRQISNNAVAQYRFKVNDTYMVKDYFAKVTELDRDEDIVDIATVNAWLDTAIDYSADPGENRDAYIFTFLDGAVISEDYYPTSSDTWTQDEIDALKEKREDKVYFLGNDSKDITKLNLSGGDMTDQTKALLEANQLMDVSHTLINAKPNVEGHTLPWTIDSDTIKKLYSFVGVNANNRPFNWLPSIYNADGQDTAWEDEHSRTDMFIKHASGNSDGTINIHGSLGIKSANEFVSTMVNGFGLGMIPAFMVDQTDDGAGTVNQTIIPDADGNTNEDILDRLATELAAAESRFFGKTLSSQEELTQALALKTEEEITNEFGTIFREIFDPQQDGVDLYYSAGNGIEVVVSDDHGIHITNTSLIDDETELEAIINEDLLEIAKDQDTTSAKVEFSTLYTNYFTVSNQIKYIDQQFDGIDGRLSFKDYYIENALSPVGTTPDHEADYERMLRMIDSEDRKAASTAAREATDSKMDWYTGAIDTKLRNINQLGLNEIYEWTYKMSGGE